MKLTIENIATELFRMNVGEWRIARIETHKNCYLFGLKKKGKQSQYQVHQFNLERNAFSDGFYLPTFFIIELFIINKFGLRNL